MDNRGQRRLEAAVAAGVTALAAVRLWALVVLWSGDWAYFNDEQSWRSWPWWTITLNAANIALAVWLWGRWLNRGPVTERRH